MLRMTGARMAAFVPRLAVQWKLGLLQLTGLTPYSFDVAKKLRFSAVGFTWGLFLRLFEFVGAFDTLSHTNLTIMYDSSTSIENGTISEKWSIPIIMGFR